MSAFVRRAAAASINIEFGGEGGERRDCSSKKLHMVGGDVFFRKHR